MADYTDSRAWGNKSYPVEAKETTDLFGRVEPILTPEQLVNRWLKSIKLTEYTNEDLQTEIELAMNEFELISGLNIYKVQHKERLPFDRDLYKSFVFTKVKHSPILSVELMSVESSNGEDIYDLPAEWLELGFSQYGRIHILPILSIWGSAGLTDRRSSNAGLIFLQAIANFHWLPAFFSITYTSGISNTEGTVPIMVNSIIGMTAAIAILGAKEAQNKYTSTSINQDGVSQGTSSQGTSIYQTRIESLTLQRDKLLNRMKAKTASKIFFSNI